MWASSLSSWILSTSSRRRLRYSGSLEWEGPWRGHPLAPVAKERQTKSGIQQVLGETSGSNRASAAGKCRLWGLCLIRKFEPALQVMQRSGRARGVSSPSQQSQRSARPSLVATSKATLGSCRNKKFWCLQTQVYLEAIRQAREPLR